MNLNLYQIIFLVFSVVVASTDEKDEKNKKKMIKKEPEYTNQEKTENTLKAHVQEMKKTVGQVAHGAFHGVGRVGASCVFQRGKLIAAAGLHGGVSRG